MRTSLSKGKHKMYTLKVSYMMPERINSKIKTCKPVSNVQVLFSMVGEYKLILIR